MISEIVVEHVTMTVGQRQILQDVNLVIRAGESLAITGPSGSGKTTLLMLAAGLQRPQQGRVLVDGAPIGTDDKSRQRFGVVLQNHGLVSVLTAMENVALPLQARGVSAEEVQRLGQAALDQVGLHSAADALVQDLSGGQQQRVAVARALVGAPDAVLADEPTSELVAEQRKVIVELLLAQAREGRILVVATHDPEVVGACDRQLRLEDGRQVEAAAIAG
ncbi:MAG: ATP-binding cassette domain-containing protein [Candidatus Dormibacteraeota bacterium]|nr:ATP-binding cassette domain-containing protein [Candidatus Dormibacteraeota bacterium]